MLKFLLAAAGLAALAGVTGVALAQDNAPPREHRGLFQSDANNDGVLTRQEFDAARASNFTRLDADNNGSLTREEMRAGRQHAGRGEHRGGRRGGGMHMLTRADANNDGNITRDEFLARPLEHFDRLDANNDGVISTAERPQRPERGDRSERRERRAERPNFDANNDGQFTRAEYDAMGAAMFQRLDANNDSRITREEAEAARPRRGRD